MCSSERRRGREFLRGHEEAAVAGDADHLASGWVSFAAIAAGTA